MSEEREEIRTIRVAYKCDKCNKGYMRYLGLVIYSNPPIYNHKCMHCGDIKSFLCNYPYSEFAQ